MHAPIVNPLEVAFAKYDLSQSSRPALAMSAVELDIAEPETTLKSVLMFAVKAGFGVASVAGTILALFAWSGAGL
jgi:hypothetical protein